MNECKIKKNTGNNERNNIYTFSIRFTVFECAINGNREFPKHCRKNNSLPFSPRQTFHIARYFSEFT